jgi:hypothetical protein
MQLSVFNGVVQMTVLIAEKPAQEAPVPTKLKRVNVTLEPELYAALESYARRCKRSLSNQVSMVLEEVLVKTGDLPAPIERKEKRGGSREKAGRPKAIPGDSAGQIAPSEGDSDE